VSTEDRLINIEIKVTAQEDLAQELSRLVYQQQKQIDKLQALCMALVKRLGQAEDEGADPDSYTHEKPPHY
jgi:SlyX protein